MKIGGHVKSVEDVEFLRDRSFDFGEAVLSTSERTDAFLHAGLKNNPDSDFRLIAHGPSEGNPNDISNIWDRYLPSLTRTIEIAQEMNIAFLTIHLWLDRRHVKPEVREEKLKFLNEMIQYGNAHRVKVSLENLSEDSRDLEDALNSAPGLGITLDVGHAQLLTDTNTSYKIIEDLGGSIAHVHLHDNRGGHSVKDDLHLPIGKGNIDFPGILEALLATGYRGMATLELENEDLESSRALLEDMLAHIARHHGAP